MSETTPAPVMPGNASRADYPRMLYNPDGQTRVVDAADEHDRLARQGWQQTPLPVHQRPVVSHTPAVGAGDPMGLLVRSVLEAVLDERGLTKHLVAQLAASFVSPSMPHEDEALANPAAPFLPSNRQRK